VATKGTTLPKGIRKTPGEKRTVGKSDSKFIGIWVVGPRTGELKKQDPLPTGRGQKQDPLPFGRGDERNACCVSNGMNSTEMVRTGLHPINHVELGHPKGTI
jgi:hypothetical protein